MTHRIDNTDDSGSKPSWENIWEQLRAYISIPYPLYKIASNFLGGFQMLLNLGLQLSLFSLHFLISSTSLNKKYQLFGKPQ